MKYCCSKFEENINQFDYSEELWNVSGCCGDGCYVLARIEFCPYCGRNLYLAYKKKDEKSTAHVHTLSGFYLGLSISVLLYLVGIRDWLLLSSFPIFWSVGAYVYWRWYVINKGVL